MRFTGVLIALFLTALGCAKVEAPTTVSTADRPVLYAVNYPLAFFAETIAGDAIDLRFPVPEGEDPAYWKPDRDTLAAMQEADCILLNGADYAKWVKTSSLPEDVLVDTSVSFHDEYIPLEGAVQHSHGPEGMHAHEGIDFNTWLDPTLAARQAEAVCGALAGLVPSLEAEFRDKLATLQQSLVELDAGLRECAELAGDTPMVASHPVYGYLARRYGLHLNSVHWEPGEMPPEDEWKGLRSLLVSQPAQVMIWEGPPTPAMAEKLRGLGLKLVVFAPRGNHPETGDYLSVMRENVRQLKEALDDV